MKILQIDEKMSSTPNLHVLVDFVGSKQCWDGSSILAQLRVPGGQVLVCYLEKTGFAVLIEKIESRVTDGLVLLASLELARLLVSLLSLVPQKYLIN